MDRVTATALIEHLKALDKPLAAATAATATIENSEERRQVRRELAQLVLRIHSNLVLPIVRQYPDLHPDKRELGP